MKCINIEIPEGFEIDVEKSDLKTGSIILKEINDELEWKDFGGVEGYWINANSEISFISKTYSGNYYKNVYPTKELAEAALALSQLLQWRNKVWEEDNNWEPNWNDMNYKFNIILYKNIIKASYSVSTHRFLSFKTSQTRDKFLRQHYQLIKKAALLI